MLKNTFANIIYSDVLLGIQTNTDPNTLVDSIEQTLEKYAKQEIKRFVEADYPTVYHLVKELGG